MLSNSQFTMHVNVTMVTTATLIGSSRSVCASLWSFALNVALVVIDQEIIYQMQRQHYKYKKDINE